MENDYLRVEPLSEEDLKKAYSQLPKEKLIDMLITSNKALELAMKDQSISYKNYYDCSDWAHCSNPFHDCINCPLMNYNNYTTSATSSTISVADFKPKTQNE